MKIMQQLNEGEVVITDTQHLNFIQILQRKRQMKKAVVDIVVVMSKHPED